MPWLSRPPSRQTSGSDPTFPGLTTNATQKNGIEQAMGAANTMPVSFIPAQIDGMCSRTAPHMTHSPITVMRQQAVLLLRNLHCLPAMLLPRAFCTKATLREYLADSIACRDLVLQCCLGIVQIAMLVLLPVMIFVLPGLMSLFPVAVFWAMIAVSMFPLNEGPRVSKVMPDGMSVREGDEVADECWIYVNSMMTSHRFRLNHLQRLSATFRRPVTGIHDRTHGFILDMIHIMFSSLLPSSTALPLMSQLRLALISPQTRKVILIVHGTGTIPMNAALDALHADLPIVCMSKLEIYAFGAASRHLNNPLLVLDELSRPDVAMAVPSRHNSNGNGAQKRTRSRSLLPQITRPGRLPVLSKLRLRA